MRRTGKGTGRQWLALLLGLVISLVAARLPADEVAGTLGAVGSDTLAGLMLRWGEQLAEHHPGVRLQLQASGSASAPPALTAGTTRLGPMSRPMYEAERDAFEARHGYPPVELALARDALVVIVHRHNPLDGLSPAELDAIFSDTRRCGAEAPIDRWSQLGVELPGDRIVLHGRNVASGTHDLFRQQALCGGSFRLRLNEHPGSAATVAAVAAEPSAIGYAGLNHLTPSVKAVKRRDAEGELQAPTPEAVRSSDYPLSRTLYLYVNLPPGGGLPGPERAFLEQVFSAEGQSVVEELGFVTLPEARLERQRRWLEALPSAE
ncbi:PstS family phosphate ABC transporter substrate-binding protein [Halomonas ramblicola]|uniref:PstS family phosphate ABC transporter substrate-binding protein n=1 Tax=Halomonas ramblicola TaxID=747349 RepID=UPI0025B350D5|nr:phosphate ABC transporter substrate-binding protein [Halomonas ramblicola]MDN3522831.1 phosphate ABC transporter substrate-binding protein [Halomonas ramblicola]